MKYELGQRIFYQRKGRNSNKVYHGIIMYIEYKYSSDTLSNIHSFKVNGIESIAYYIDNDRWNGICEEKWNIWPMTEEEHLQYEMEK